MAELTCPGCDQDMNSDGDLQIDQVTLLMVLECPACGKEYECIDTNPIVLQEVDPEERDYAQDRGDEIDDLLKGEDTEDEE